jgi:lipoprotein-anchoring transpeptidase ErfK/SrfK
MQLAGSLSSLTRRVWITLAMFALVIMPGLGLSNPVAAQDSSEQAAPGTYWDASLNAEVPGELGQTSVVAYVPETGHSIGGYMLDYWRAQGASSVYGDPISEGYGAKSGYYSQAFAGGIFQFRYEYVWTDTPSMTLEPIGAKLLRTETGKMRRDGKRQGGGGDRRASAYRKYGADSGVAQKAAANGALFDATSGHSVSDGFLAWYQTHEGDWYLGRPLTQPVEQHGIIVQYFEGAVLQRDKSGNVTVVPVVARNPKLFRIDTTSVAQNGLPSFSEALFATSPNPNPIGDQNAPGRKWIEISLSQQTAWIYQGSTVIGTTLVSTGLEPNPTLPGNFHVRYKLPTQDMAGAVNADGQVVALGQGAADAASDGLQAGESPYVVQDVPNVMYFNMEAEALHGAYWHNNFGNPMSHGCINLPLSVAAWLYGWAPLGTEVWVHD